MPRNPADTRPALAAIDVGTNAARLKLVRVRPDGTLATVVAERDPIRPGEGVFKTGTIPRRVANRLMATLTRWGELARRHRARVRAVATSALREARNRDEIVRRAREEAGVLLEVVSGMEEARLICVGVLEGRPADARTLCVDIGGGSTEVATAIGERPQELWSVALGAVRLTDIFVADAKIPPKKLELMRSFAREAIEEALPSHLPFTPDAALGSSGTINAIVQFSGTRGTPYASADELSETVAQLAALGPGGRRKRFDARRADIIVAGAVVLEALVSHFRLEGVTAVDRGLRDGLILDLLRRPDVSRVDTSLSDAAIAIGRRFHFDESHARQVARIAVELFDDLIDVHRLPDGARPYLEVAALLHDVGHAVNYRSHHKHTYYLIQNADIPGVSDRERELIARIARFHRRSLPEPTHALMAGLSEEEHELVRKLATVLRVADALDRSHHQPVTTVRAAATSGRVSVRLRARAPIDLELWDAQHEVAFFERVFGKRLKLALTPGG